MKELKTMNSMLSKLENNILKCNKCPRLLTVTKFPYPHIIYANSVNEIELFVIGRNPGLEYPYTGTTIDGYLEDYKQKYKICKFGKYLELTLGQNFWSKTAISNLCKCSSPQNSVLLPEEINNCSEYLTEQIKLFKPKIILLVGKEASSFAFKENFSQLMGEENYLHFNSGTYIFAIYHPSFLSRGFKEIFSQMNNNKLSKIREILNV